MFNVTIIRLKDIIKYPVSLAIIMIIVYCSTRYFFNVEKNKDKINFMDNFANYTSKYVLYPIQKQFGLIQAVNKSEKTEEEDENLIDENIEDADEDFNSYMLNTALKLQLGIINVTEFKETIKNEDDNNNETGEIKVENHKEEIKLATQNEETKVVTENPIKEAYTNKYNTIKIKNETKFKLSEEILNPSKLDIDKNNVLIFHTHTCESYTQSKGYEYKSSGNFRTTDLNYSVARVGDTLKKYLTEYEFNVIHNKSVHDYPAYSGSYNRSLKTVKNVLQENKSDIIIDLHRDAIGSNSKYAPTVKIGEDYCAQLMFVIGTNRWRIRT